MGEHPHGKHPNTLANLKAGRAAPFTGADDPRRKNGAPNVGRRITAFFNELCAVDDDGKAVYDLMTLRKIAADPKAPHPKAIAASVLLSAREQGYDKIDRQPKSLAAIRELLDRMLGKPHVTLEVTRNDRNRTASEVIGDIRRLMESSPELAAAVRGAPLVETTAKVLGSDDWGNAVVKDIEQRSS